MAWNCITKNILRQSLFFFIITFFFFKGKKYTYNKIGYVNFLTQTIMRHFSLCYHFNTQLKKNLYIFIYIYLYIKYDYINGCVNFLTTNFFHNRCAQTTIYPIFLLILHNKTNFPRNRVCLITCPLPVGKIRAHMAGFYCQNKDF